VVLLVCAAWLLLSGYVMHAAVARPVVDLPFQNRDVVRSFFPEGWAFFTRDPREPATRAYVRKDGWRPAAAGANGEPRHLFGLRRTPRARIGELNDIMQHLPQGAWRDCAGGWQSCLESTPPSVTLVSHAAEPNLCGRVGLIRHRPVPWAWSTAVTPDRMPSQVIALDITC
jgi:antimicrobial peptide system SdpA family protein